MLTYINVYADALHGAGGNVLTNGQWRTNAFSST